MKKNITLLFGIVLLSPIVVFAQEQNFIVQIVDFLDAIISALFPLIIVSGVIVFAYNLINYLASKDKIDQSIAKAGILNSLLALFILFTIFGTIKILAQTFGIPSLGDSLTIADPSGLGGTGGKTLRDYAFIVARFISQRVIPIMVSVAVLVFSGNVVIAMTKTDSQQERTNLNAYLRWGILAIFVLLTVFSLVSILTGTFFGTQAFIPQFPTS